MGFAALNPTYTALDHTELPPLPLGEGWSEGIPDMPMAKGLLGFAALSANLRGSTIHVVPNQHGAPVGWAEAAPSPKPNDPRSTLAPLVEATLTPALS